MKNCVYYLSWMKQLGESKQFHLNLYLLLRLSLLLVLAVLPSFVSAQNMGICNPFHISRTHFFRDGGTGIIDVCGDTDWRIDNPADWITFSPPSGRGRGKVAFYVAPNPGAPRHVNVLIKGQVVVFRQSDVPPDPKEYLYLDPTSGFLNFPYSGSAKHSVKLYSDVAWTLRSDQPWLKIEPEQGMGDATITITAGLNPTKLSRTATIYVDGFSSSNTPLHRKITVSQSASPRPVANSEFLRPELFDAEFYLRLHEDVRVMVGAANHAGAANHWVTRGIYEGKTSSPIFSSKYYLSVHPDLKAVYGETNYAAAIVHWLTYGQREGRRSAPMFHSRHYLGMYPDLQRAFGKDNFPSAIQHFRLHGLNEGRESSPWFAADWYLANNPDVAQAVGRRNFRGGLVHWLNNGRVEGRPGSPFGQMIPFGPIQDKWEQLGASQSVIGNPINTTVDLPKNNGKFNHFQHGSIYWSPQTGAFEVHGMIRDKWASLGWEWSVLGYPTSDEIPTADGVGRYSRFEHGWIYWTPQTGAFEIHGAIGALWMSLGAERSNLGYPLTDESLTSCGGGRYNHFQHGSIYWTHQTGAHLVRGAIRGLWASLGWECSFLGFPTSDEIRTPDGRGWMNHFQGGTIVWYPETGPRVIR